VAPTRSDPFDGGPVGRRRVVGPRLTGSGEAQLVVDRPGHLAEEPLLPAPRPGEGDVVEQEVVHLGEAVLAEAVLHQPVPAGLVDHDEIDAQPVEDAPAVRRQEPASRPGRVGDGHVEQGLDLDGAPRVGRRRPVVIGGQHPAPGGPGGLGALRPEGFVEPRGGERRHDGPAPVPHAGEVVDGEGVLHGLGEIEGAGRPGGFETLPFVGGEVPRPAAAEEQLPFPRPDDVVGAHPGPKLSKAERLRSG